MIILIELGKSKPNSGLFYQNYKNENGIVSIDSKKKKLHILN